MADYDLLSVPVVDDHDRLLGVIALDDLIEHLLPDGPQ
jgi:Mg/Co/Ni transporter MgtE